MRDQPFTVSLVARYAGVGLVGGGVGAVLAWYLGLVQPPLVTALSTGSFGGIIGGAVGGWIRQRRGKTD